MNRNLLVDLKLQTLQRSALTIAGVVDGRQRRVEGRRSVELRDYRISEGRPNLEQAITLRLLTGRGELGALGHPDYGSRLHELVGRQNTANTRNLAKLFTLEALQQEPRIASVLSVDVSFRAQAPQHVFIAISVQPIGDDVPLNIGPLTLEL